uniref:Uncharacterized protein n=1 Tax=Globisporangium ultimum (strain ATCC 200006 / CBS 805.95 / DAOM BR144) TaxID=431595 RepID=K3X7Y6_GLOUD
MPGPVVVDYDASLTDASDVVAKVIVTGDSEALVNLVDVISWDEHEKDGLKIHLNNPAESLQGHLLMKLFVKDPQALQYIKALPSADVLIGNNGETELSAQSWHYIKEAERERKHALKEAKRERHEALKYAKHEQKKTLREAQRVREKGLRDGELARLGGHEVTDDTHTEIIHTLEEVKQTRREAFNEAKRAREEAKRETEQALKEGEEARKEGLEEAKRAREEAERAREEALKESERARREGIREAKRARKEAKRECEHAHRYIYEDGDGWYVDDDSSSNDFSISSDARVGEWELAATQMSATVSSSYGSASSVALFAVFGGVIGVVGVAARKKYRSSRSQYTSIV